MSHNYYGSSPYPEYPHGYNSGGGIPQQPHYSQSAYTMGHPPPLHQQPSVRVGMVISYGFKAVFEQPLMWILGALVYLVVVHGPNAFFAPDTSDMLTGIYTTDLVNFGGVWSTVASLLCFPIVFTVALLQLDGVPITVENIKAKLNYPQALLTNFLMNIIMIGVLFTVSVIFLVSALMLVPDDSVGAIFIGVVFVVFVMFALYLVCMTLFGFSLLFAVDGRAFTASALKQSIYFGRKSFWPLVAFHLLSVLIVTSGSLLSLGLAAVILIPAISVNAAVHVYRQATNAYYPQK